MIRLLVSGAFAAAVLLLSCGAGMVTTFSGQELPRDQTARLLLKEKVGRRNLDSIMFCFVVEIDGVNLAEKHDLHQEDPEEIVKSEGVGMDVAERLDRLDAEFDLAQRLRSLMLSPGEHSVKIEMFARSTLKRSSDLIYSMTPIELSLDAEPGHSYQPHASYDREVWTAWLEDKNTGEIAAINRLEH